MSSDAARLGPLVIYNIVFLGRRTWVALGFDLCSPADELHVVVRYVECRLDWHAHPDDRIVGQSGFWAFRARKFEPFIHTVDIAQRPIAPDDRELLALALLNGGAIDEEWKPPMWFPQILDSGFVLATGGIVRRPPPHRLAHAPWERPQLDRHGVAATLAALLTGEGTFDGAIEAANALRAGQLEETASRSPNACLLVETIDALLANETDKVPSLARALICAAPKRPEVFAVLQRVTASDQDEEVARLAWRTSLKEADLDGLEPFSPSRTDM